MVIVAQTCGPKNVLSVLYSMAMGTQQKRERQEDPWVVSSDVAKAPAHAFYER
jgi:hypothetical protein